jgi:hypothetical protein
MLTHGPAQATVRGRGGKAWLDIREFYKKDGQRLPTKRGALHAKICTVHVALY